MIVNQLISTGVSFVQWGFVRNSKKKEITVGMCQKNYIWKNGLGQYSVLLLAPSW